MKKRIFVMTFLVSFAAASVALAAVSSPCGARKPVKKEVPAAPRVVKERGDYKRNVIGQKVPVYTDKKGDSLNDEATKYWGTFITGSERK